jgi:hypothetical protein
VASTNVAFFAANAKEHADIAQVRAELEKLTQEAELFGIALP